MGTVERRLGSGLVAVEIGTDGAALERELQKRDPALQLQGWPAPEWGCISWRVVRTAGLDRPPETICYWMNEATGEPYPLSSALLDKVDQLDRNSRGVYVSAEERNARREAEIAKQQERDNEAMLDWIPRHGRPVLPRSQSLRLARDKRRAKGEKC